MENRTPYRPRIKRGFQLPLTIVFGLAFFVFGLMYHAASFAVLGAIFSYSRTVSETTILVNLRDISYIIFTLLGIVLIQRWSSRRIFLISLGTMAVCAAGVPFLSHNFTFAELLFVLTGACFGLVRLSAYWLIRVYTQRHSRFAQKIMLIEGMYFLGISLSYNIFLPYLQNIDVSWTEAYWIVLPFILLAILVQFAHPSYNLSVGRKRRFKSEFRYFTDSFNKLFNNPMFIIFIFCVLLVSGMQVHFLEWAKAFIDELLVEPTNQFFNLQALGMLFGIMTLSRLLFGFVLRYLGRSFILGSCIIALMAIILWGQHLLGDAIITPARELKNISLYSLFLPATSFLFAPLLPLIFIFIILQVSDKRQLFVIGLLLSVSTLAQMVVQSFSEHVYNYLVIHTAFYFLLIPLALFLVFFFLMYADIVRVNKKTRKNKTKGARRKAILKEKNTLQA